MSPTTTTTPPTTAPADEDLAEQALPGHGIPSQDPSLAAQVPLAAALGQVRHQLPGVRTGGAGDERAAPAGPGGAARPGRTGASPRQTSAHQDGDAVADLSRWPPDLARAAVDPGPWVQRPSRCCVRAAARRVDRHLRLSEAHASHDARSRIPKIAFHARCGRAKCRSGVIQPTKPESGIVKCIKAGIQKSARPHDALMTPSLLRVERKMRVQRG